MLQWHPRDAFDNEQSSTTTTATNFFSAELIGNGIHVIVMLRGEEHFVDIRS